jgi:hypothetical protein
MTKIRKKRKAKSAIEKAKDACEAAWKAACRRRDKDTCQVCKKTNVVIQVDHCFSRACMWLFFDPSNGTTLCSGCHSMKTFSNKAMDKIVDDLVFMREGFRWWDEAMKRAQSLEPKKWTLDELEKQTERLNSLWV